MAIFRRLNKEEIEVSPSGAREDNTFAFAPRDRSLDGGVYHNPVKTEGTDEIEYPQVSDVLYPSGEAHFQDFTDKTSNPPEHYTLAEGINIGGAVAPFDNEPDLWKKNALGGVEEKGAAGESIFAPDGLTFPSELSNGKKSRDDAIKKGLYDASGLGTYINWKNGKTIDYTDNYKITPSYIDPYSDEYIFQTSRAGLFSSDSNTAGGPTESPSPPGTSTGSSTSNAASSSPTGFPAGVPKPY